MAKLFRVEVYRTSEASLFVMADSREEAIEDAKELVSWDDFDVSADDYSASESDVAKVPDFEQVWSGGPDGDWIDAAKVVRA